MTVKLSSPFIEALALMPRGAEVNDNVLNSSSPSPRTTLKIVAAMWACGWLVFGLISIISLNGRGRAGRWVPEWYLDYNSTKWAKLAVIGWWVCVMLFWPIIWVIVLFGATGRIIKKRIAEWKEARKERREMAAVAV
ncbi:hypothetical protein FHETE_4397 [Fusarium heterosporum]|uniref:Uncharacterized protein n=1 Tax=Fusarium heterosporum TaxID=42747 RepID=A0A8H5WTK5_FUSHE|nr:hypothetical protein FHETE_4397 [Fusarium heterosporum]